MRRAEADGADPEHAEDLDRLGGKAQQELHRDQIQDHTHGPGDPVLGAPEPARTMMRLDLHQRDAHPTCDGRNEPVHLAVQPEVLDDLTAVRLQRAAVVVEPNPGHFGNEPVGEHGGQAPADERVLPILPPPADDVVVLRQREESGDVRGVVLQIAVQGHDDLATRVIESRRQRGRLSEVPAQRHQDPARVCAADRFEPGPGRVCGPVVHRDHLVADAMRIQRLADLLGEDRNVLLLVEDRDHDGERGALGAGHGMLLSTRRRVALWNPRNSWPRKME